MGAIEGVVLGKAGHERFSRSVVKILGLLSNAVVALVLEAAFHATQAWAFVACNQSNQLLMICLRILASAAANLPQVRWAL